jgi:hypothetical protein
MDKPLATTQRRGLPFPRMTSEAELDRLFPLGPDSLPQPGVPAGRLEKHTFTASRLFPGTVRDYWIYVPANYDAARPACVMIVQDGWDHLRPERRWRMPVIFDNLIHQRAIPASLGIFLNPGVIPATRDGAPERIQRSFEYDRTDDRYARFLIEEIIPAVAARYPAADRWRQRDAARRQQRRLLLLQRRLAPAGCLPSRLQLRRLLRRPCGAATTPRRSSGWQSPGRCASSSRAAARTSTATRATGGPPTPTCSPPCATRATR